MSSAITLDFCVWLHRNFDALLEVMPEWHEGYVAAPVKPSPAPVPAKVAASVPVSAKQDKFYAEYMKLLKFQKAQSKSKPRR